MIFQVKTTRQKCNLIIGMYAAWEARKIYECWSRGEVQGRSTLSPMQWSCWLATAAPPEVPLMARGMLQQIPKDKESWAD